MQTDSSPATRTFTFKHCWVHVSPGYTETVFHDGTRVTASPEDSEEYRTKARRYGYNDDIAALSCEHELLHTFLAEAFGLGSSPTLWAVAHGQLENMAPLWAQEEEEVFVLAFQVYLNGGEAAEALSSLEQHGLNREALRVAALRLLRG